jgi:hypothetical protein
MGSVNVTLLNSFIPANNAFFKVITFASLSSSFASLEWLFPTIPNVTFTPEENANGTEIDILVANGGASPVPEPASLLLVLGGLGLMYQLKRSRKRQ